MSHLFSTEDPSVKVKINHIFLLERWSDRPWSYESDAHVHRGSDRFYASGPIWRLLMIYNRHGECCSTFPGCSFRIRTLISLMPGALAGDGSQLGAAFDQEELLSPRSHTLPGAIYIKWWSAQRDKGPVALHQFKTSLMDLSTPKFSLWAAEASVPTILLLHFSPLPYPTAMIPSGALFLKAYPDKFSAQRFPSQSCFLGHLS